MNYLFFKNQTIALYLLYCIGAVCRTNSDKTNWNPIIFFTNFISSFLSAARKRRKYQHLHGEWVDHFITKSDQWPDQACRVKPETNLEFYLKIKGDSLTRIRPNHLLQSW